MATTSWRKSSKSANSGDQNCVEARAEARENAQSFQVRDSKLGESSPVFDLAESDFASLLGAARR
jgi:hypothetical protein